MSLATRWGLACIAAAALLGGCSHPRYYGEAEHRLKTDDFFESQGHFAVYYPAGIALSFPGYVVGIENGDKATVTDAGDLVVDHVTHAGSSITQLSDVVAEGEIVPFISQVIRYSGRPLGAGNCALYSLYQSDQRDLLPFCTVERQPRIGAWHEYRSAYVDSWRAIALLKAALQRDLASGKYTHLIVAMMGWRTPQEEAIRNFNSIMRSLYITRRGEFRPLFVGITWVGPWADRWLDPIVEVFSYGKIANLADILGLTWLGVLTDEIVIPLGDKVDTVFITHSFGARAASTAICIGPAIRRHAEVASERPPGTVGHLIGFEAAFSLQRFKEERPFPFYEDIFFPAECARAKSIVLTASAYDEATRTILWADLAGNYRYFRSFCRSNASLASCVSVNEGGNFEQEYDASKRVLYIDASKLIRFKAPGTDGGGHSDIFRPPVGRLIWNITSKPGPEHRPKEPDAGAAGRSEQR
jgi:hypothetical protein